MAEDQDDLFKNLGHQTKTEEIVTEIDLTDKGDKKGPEIEIIDDTPEQDRDRKPPEKKLSTDDPSDEELLSYSEKVRARINTLTFEKHEARRIAEAASREHNEAVNYLKALQEENKRLKDLANVAGTALKGEATKGAESALAAAKHAYKKAYEDGNADGMVEAQQAIAAAQYALEDARRYEAPKWEEEKKEEKPQEQRRQPSREEQVAREKMDDWLSKNPWFLAPKGFEAMKGFGYGMHAELMKNGITPDTDEYYKHIDRAYRKQFPEFSWGGEVEEKPRRGNVVAPAGRSVQGNSNKIRLTQSQVNLAKRLGLTPEQYAAELKRLNDNVQ